MANLVVGDLTLKIEAARQYPGRWQVVGQPFYIDVACTREIANAGFMSYISGGSYSIQDPALFLNFWRSWTAGTLKLYRGFPGCHFCWENLLKGKLKSEGDRDYPEFTMSDTGRGTTCWLPTAELNIAQGVSIQCTDIHTQALSDQEPVPIGFTVEIAVGPTLNTMPICWLNAGEIVVRGPLDVPFYKMHSIAWFDNRNVRGRRVSPIPSFRPNVPINLGI